MKTKVWKSTDSAMEQTLLKLKYFISEICSLKSSRHG
jgi:hypothetical protein